jgi:hypothetical protein
MIFCLVSKGLFVKKKCCTWKFLSACRIYLTWAGLKYPFFFSLSKRERGKKRWSFLDERFTFWMLGLCIDHFTNLVDPVITMVMVFLYFCSSWFLLSVYLIEIRFWNVFAGVCYRNLLWSCVCFCIWRPRQTSSCYLSWFSSKS